MAGPVHFSPVNLNQSDNTNHKLRSRVSCLSPRRFKTQTLEMVQKMGDGSAVIYDYNRNQNRLSSMLVNMTLRHMNLTVTGLSRLRLVGWFLEELNEIISDHQRYTGEKQ